jgi:hypothetical protein
VSACGCTGGIFAGSDAVVGGLDAVIPVDGYIPGCPPTPLCCSREYCVYLSAKAACPHNTARRTSARKFRAPDFEPPVTLAIAPAAVSNKGPLCPLAVALELGHQLLSPELAEKLRPFVTGRSPEEPLFTTARGKRLHPDNFVKRVLKPILMELGLPGAVHAFRHGNATLLDQLGAPMKVRQDRLGHMHPETTMLYTHAVSADERRIAAELGRILHGSERNQQEEGPAPKALTPMIQ